MKNPEKSLTKLKAYGWMAYAFSFLAISLTYAVIFSEINLKYNSPSSDVMTALYASFLTTFPNVSPLIIGDSMSYFLFAMVFVIVSNIATLAVVFFILIPLVPIHINRVQKRLGYFLAFLNFTHLLVIYVLYASFALDFIAFGALSFSALLIFSNFQLDRISLSK